MAPILSSVPIVRVQFIRTVNNKTVSPNAVTATPTVPYLTVAGQHGFIDPLQQETSQVDSNNVGYLDLVATDDTDVTEAFGWTIAFAGSTRPTRTVSVPQSGGAIRSIVTDDGFTMPAIWLSDLADFSGASGPVGSTVATQSYVTGAISALQAASDPFPQYAVDAQALPAGGSSGQVLSKTSNADYAVGWAAGGSGGSTFTQSATKTAAYTAADNQIVPLDTSGGTFTLTGPTSGKPFGARWKAGTAAPTIAAPAGYTINGAATLTMGLAPGSSTGELVTYQAVGTDYQAFGGFKPQSALTLRHGDILNTHLLAWTYAQAFRLVSATRDVNEAITTASVVWPDGASGTFTTTTASTAFPGAIDAYNVTYSLSGGTAKTVTQPAVTRDTAGAVTAQPALTIA